MKPIYRGLAVAALQCMIVLSVAAKYSWDRERLPRVWAKSAPYDPNLPLRGRYVSLRLEVGATIPAGGLWSEATLSVNGDRLVATPVSGRTGVQINCPPTARCTIAEPVAFFIAEHIPDPSRRQPGEELWVEVSVPPKGPPRPIRLGVKKDGVLRPLDLQ
jgi:hypothetical protein